MARVRHLTNAPVTEALVDLRAAPSVGLEHAEVVKRLRAALAARYPRYAERRVLGAEVEVRPGQPLVPKAADSGLHGHFFETEDARDIAQFRIDGFTYNRLAPYTNGESIIAEALRLWSIYLEVARPLGVSRVALRYINILRLPIDVRLDDYLVRVPAAPAGTPGDVQRFLLRVETFDAQSGHRVITTHALTPAMPPDSVNLVIDIDAFRLGDFHTSPEALRPILDALRELKNSVFFGTITEKAVERYV
jgi:uncharacterized protein (TIGR04255 family)